MDDMKCVKDGFAGGAIGFGLGLLLWVPSCVVGTIAKGTERQGESIANSIFWLCLFGGAIVGYLVSFAEEQKKDTERQRAEQENRRLAEERERAEQTSIHSSLVTTATTTLKLFEAMPGHLVTAEEWLDQAERDFNEGAFSPFWSSVEKATMRLGAFDEGIHMITTNAKQHGELSNRYKGTSPRFPIILDSVRGMTAANTTTDRLNSIVRKAQRNFQFATIYEQRKTNQLLTAGFTTLAQALDGMGQRIASSIDDIGERISEVSEVVEGSLSGIGEQLQAATEGINALHDTTKEAETESKKRHDRALEMLDNIQRHRQPAGFYLGIGTKPAP